MSIKRAIATGLVLAALAGCGKNGADNGAAAANGQQSVQLEEPLEESGNGSDITAIDAATGDAGGLAPDISPDAARPAAPAAAARPTPTAPPQPAEAVDAPASNNATTP